MGVILGAVGSLWAPVRGYEYAVVAGCVFCVVAAIAARSRFGLLCICIAGICFGVWRGSSVLAGHETYEEWFNEVVYVSGRVVSDPEYFENGVRFRLHEPLVEGEKMSGIVWVHSSQPIELKRSYEVTARGLMSQGFGTTPAALYDAELITVHPNKHSDYARDIRDWFSAGIAAAVPGPGAQLGSGILLGQKSALPERLEQDLLVLGLTHIVVASGYNLTILVKVARKLALPISRFTALVVSVMLIMGFLSVTGLSPSMVRASLVAGFSLVAWYYGRKTHPVVLLACVGGITVGINPTYVWGDLGWMLSFLSFVGVLVVAPLINAYFWGQKPPGLLRGVLIETVSAQVLTVPLLVYVFGYYSPLSIVSNMLIVPTIPLVMAFVFIAGIAGVIYAPIAWLFGLPASISLWYHINSAKFLAELPVAQQELTLSLWGVLVSYIVAVTVLYWAWKRTAYDFRNRVDEWI